MTSLNPEPFEPTAYLAQIGQKRPKGLGLHVGSWYCNFDPSRNLAQINIQMNRPTSIGCATAHVAISDVSALYGSDRQAFLLIQIIATAKNLGATDQEITALTETEGHR